MHHTELQAATPPPGITSLQRPRRLPGLRNRLKLAGAGLMAAAVVATPILGTMAPSFAATPPPAPTPTDGALILNQQTLPRGAVWLDDNAGGHLWVSDNVQGICRVDALAGANPPWQRTNCQGAAP